MIDPSIAEVHFILFASQHMHRHLSTFEIFDLLRISALIRPSRVKEVELLFCEEPALSRISCEHCK
jgi:hypothetical protein